MTKAVFIWPAVFLLAGFKSGLILSISIGLAVYLYLTYSSSEFAVTNKPVLAKVGILSRRSIEILLTKIEGISVNQGLVGRSWNYGTIVVSGTGGTKEPFNMIAKPFEFRKQVQEQIAIAQTAK